MTAIIENPLISFGKPDGLEATLGLSPQTAPKIAAIIVFAGNVEFRLERAIWRLQNHAPKGVRHATDAKPVMALIDMLAQDGAKLAGSHDRQLIEDWCATARIAFEFRHSIAHGVAFRFDTVMGFERNRAWQGELRKRPAASLWANPHTFENIRLTFAVLLRVMNRISNERRPWETVTNPTVLKAVKWARSLMEEMASGHGPEFEKY